MKIFLKHIMRNIKENIGRTSLIVVSLFGVALLLSISLGISFSFKSLWDSLSESIMGGFNATVESTTEEKVTIDRIKEVGVDFDYLGISFYNYGYIKTKDEFVSSPLVGLSIDEAIDMRMLSLPDVDKVVLKENEVITSTTFAKKNKLKKGNKFNYYDEDGVVHELTVKYIAEDAGAFLQDLSFVSNNDTFLKILGTDKIEYEFFCLKYNGNKDLMVLRDELNSIEDDYGLDFYMEEEPELMDIVGNWLKIGVIAIIMVLIVVYFTLNSIVKIIINERIPVIGTFRSVGSSISKMNSILLMEMATYGIIGGVCGGLTGVLFTKAIFLVFEMVDEMLGITINMGSFETYSIIIVILTVALLVLFQISLSISEILKSSKLSIKDCIFNKHESIYKYSVNKLLFGFCFLAIGIISLLFNSKLNFTFSVISIISIFTSIAFLLPSFTRFLSKYLDKIDNPVLHMAKNTIVNNKLQINTNVIVAVMMCVSLISFALLNYSIKSYKSSLDMVQSDLYVVSSSEPNNVTNDIRAIDNLDRVSVLYVEDFTLYFSSLKFANNELNELTVLYSDDYEALAEDSNVLDLDGKLANKLKDNEVIVSEYFREIYDLKVGDIVVLNGINEEERFTVETPINLKIVGFADTSAMNHMSIILSEKIIEDTVDYFSEQHYFIQMSDDAKLKDVKKDIMKSLTYQMPQVLTKKEYVELTKEGMEEIYLTIIEVILIIIGVALVGIINNQSVSFLERKREMAVLYSTAMSRSQINKMIFIEVFLSYFISALVSIIFTIMLLILLKQTLMVLGLYMPITFSIVSILILMFVIGIIMTVIYLVMKRKIKKMNIVEELKYE
ncbi:MAG: ABC transporter permease [Bacilli bacterium]|nr:ABC transporter permease [Bacilli bacterium]